MWGLIFNFSNKQFIPWPSAHEHLLLTLVLTPPLLDVVFKKWCLSRFTLQGVKAEFCIAEAKHFIQFDNHIIMSNGPWWMDVGLPSLWLLPAEANLIPNPSLVNSDLLCDCKQIFDNVMNICKHPNNRLIDYSRSGLKNI